MTKRLLKASVLQLISAVLGSVFGLMSVFGESMAFVEKYYSALVRKIKQRGVVKRRTKALRNYINALSGPERHLDRPPKDVELVISKETTEQTTRDRFEFSILCR
jgi:hypothetical protein